MRNSTSNQSRFSRLSFFIAFLLLISYSASAQFYTKHYIAPAPWQYFSKSNEIVIATNSVSPVTITLSRSNGVVETTLTASKGNPAIYRFALLAKDLPMYALNTVVSGAGLIVTSTGPTSVNMRNVASDDNSGENNDAYLKGNAALTSFGDAGLGVRFRVGYYRDGSLGNFNNYGDQRPIYTIMATVDNTTVKINNLVATTLNAGQSYLFKAPIGTLVESSNLTVMNTSAAIDTPNGCGDSAYNQIPPESVLGTEYFIERGKGNDTAEQTTVVATKDNTNLVINTYSTAGALTGTINYTLPTAGSFYTFNNGILTTPFSASRVSADKKVVVYSGTAQSCEVDISTIAPVSECGGSNFIETAKFRNYGTGTLPYFGYILLRSATDPVMVNGTNIETVSGIAARHQLGTTGWYLINFEDTQIGSPDVLSIASATKMTVSIVQQGGGFSMAGFFSNFAAQPEDPTLTYISGGGCTNNTAELTTPANFAPYQWYFNGTAITGANSSTYTATKTGNYSVSSTLACGAQTQSKPVSVTLCTDLGITKTIDNASPCIGSNVEFTVKVSNLGGNNVSGVSVSDLLPSGYTYVSSIPSIGIYDSSTGSWSIGDVDAQTSVTLKIVATVKSSGNYTNTASLPASIDINTANNSASAAVNPKASNLVVTNPAAVCSPSTVDLTASAITAGSSANLTLSYWTDSLATTSYSTPTTASAGTYYIKAVSSDGCVFVKPVVVTVNAQPSTPNVTSRTSGATISNGSISCFGGSSITLRATNSSGYLWSTGETTRDIVVTADGVYSVKVMNSSNCTSSSSSAVTVTFVPAAPVASNQTFCSSENKKVGDLVATGNSIKWYSANTGGTALSTNQNLPTTAGTYNYYASQTSANNCESTRTAIVVTINSTSSAPTASAQTFCAADNKKIGDLSPSGPTIKWYSASSGGSALSSNQALATGTYFVSQTVNSCGESARTSVAVTINNVPSAPTASSQTFCINDAKTVNDLAVTLIAGSTKKWYNASTAGTAYTGTELLTTRTYYVSQTNACGESTRTAVAVTVNSTAAPTSSAQTFCAIDNKTVNDLAVTLTSGASKKWYNANTGGTTYGGNEILASGTYYVSQILNGCESARTSVVVTVNNTATPTANSQTFCVIDNKTVNDLEVTLISGATKKWYSASSGGTLYDGTETLVSKNYFVSQTLNNCESGRILVAVTVNPTPATPSISAGGSTTFCTGGNVVLTSTSGIGYLWSNGAKTQSITVSNSGNYSVQVSNASGCYSASSTAVNITVNTIPSAPLASDQTFCFVDGKKVSDLLATGNDLKWYNANSGGTLYLGTETLVNGTYYVSQTTNSCESIRTAVNVTITPKPAKVVTTATICSGEKYTWSANSIDYTVGGTYPISNNGCTADQELQLTVTPKPAKVVTTATICSGEKYTWSANSTDYTVGGTYPISNNGCTADQELQLTVTPKPAKVVTTATICSGDTYTWTANSTDYTASGTYPISNNGCTADQELQLTVTPKPAKVVTTATICSGEKYTWSANSTDYTASGTYPIYNNGCTADQELQLTVTPKPAKVVTTATICSGEKYTWSANSTDYTVGGTYPILNNGCTADQELQLTVTPKPAKVVTTATICSGEKYTWSANSTDYTVGGTYPILNNGCTADQELQLTVTPKPAKVVTTATICSGDTYTWTVNSTTYTTGGTYTVANNGCTADQELQLTVTPKPAKVVTTATICSGEKYTWSANSTDYITSGTYPIYNNGCTADQELQLTVTPKPAKVVTTATICSGEKYTWSANSTDYTASGTYPILNNGCTADQELQLTVTPKPAKVVTTATICSGETYTWSANSTDYTASGTYPILNNGCTADQELQLTVTPKPAKVVTTATICSGETYTWSANSTDYTASGTYPIYNNGCTADQELQLTVTPKPAKVVTTATICSGEKYTWSANSTDYITSGTYPIYNNGCTADQELQLTVTPKPAKVVTTATICSGEKYTWNANSTDYTVGGTYPILNNGCTADQELQLTVTPKPAKVVTTATICSGEKYTWSANSTDYTTGGTYPISNNGCTADQELQLTVTPKPAKVVTTATICSGEKYTWSANSTDYTVGGIYPIYNNGCTADQELQLTVTPKPAKVVTTATICSGEKYTWSANSTDYTVGGIYPIYNNGCTADQELQLTVTPKPAKVVTTATICSGEKYTWSANSTDYTASGTYPILNNGCTADQELQLTVTPKPAKVVTTATICSGEKYTWSANSTDYTAGGTYPISNNGCTADQELQLTVTPKPAKVVTTATICSGEKYTWSANSTDYTVGGIYPIYNNGCTADQELQLTVTPKPAKVVTTATICSGEKYTWSANSTDYTVGGIYPIYNNGCTADQELQLTVTPKPAKVVTTATICSGEKYTWSANSTDYTASGTYPILNNGCTADQELQLTVTPKPAKVVTTATICSGEKYTWSANSTDYTAGGTYPISNNGCTADQELQLTVTPKPAKVVTTATICSGEKYTWSANSTDYTVGGIYPIYNNGCTADQELQLTVTPKPAKVVTTATICSGEKYTWSANSTDYTVGGIYPIYNNGCTVDQELQLTVTPKPAKVVTTATICSGEKYTWSANSTDYTASGTYPILNNGCTADQELQLTVTPKPAKVVTTATICSGEKYTWSANSTDYTAGGTYPIYNNGCTADQELQLTVTPKPAKVVTTATICSGEKYTWSANSTDYTVGGIYPIYNNGCTVDQELQLTVTPKPAKVVTTATICSGEKYTWSANSTDYTASGTYPILNNGCTADQELQLTVTPKPAKVVTTATICSGEKYTWSANSTDYTAGGTYPIYNNGCTADQELQLTVTPKPAKVVTTATICSGEKYTWSANSTDYTAGGTYPIYNNGCTADQELQLTVTPKPAKVVTTATICSGDTYTWTANATAYTVGGTYPIYNNGCTADQELQLTVTPKPAKVVTTATICSGDTYTWTANATAYTVGGTYPIYNNGCTADQELQLTVTPKPAKVVTTATICSGDTYTWTANATAYTTGGTYTVANNGCTADQELQLTVTPKPAKVVTTATICSGDTYTWTVNSTAYTTGGTYTVANNGCTADQELQLTVTPKPAKVVTTATICSGEKYTWSANSTDYTASGTYPISNNGCTADQELQLTVTPKPAKVVTTATICSGEKYTWSANSTDYTASGTYLILNNGCTADQELQLTVTPKPAKVVTTATICSGDTYTWTANSTAYTVGGTYPILNNGCTADQELQLTVTPKPAKIITTATICSGDTYTWTANATAYTLGGTYAILNNGCTADQELQLTVTPKPAKVVTTATICSGEKYTWSANSTDYTTGGTYPILNNGCTADQELQLTVTPKPAKVVTTATICSGEKYTWSANSTDYTTGGTYPILNNGCTADQELQLTVTPKPAKVVTTATICSGEKYTWSANSTDYTIGGTYTVANNGCTADQELQLTVINVTSPIVGLVTQPTCASSVASVELSGLPTGSWTINPGNITGNTATTTITGLIAGNTYNYTVTDSLGCQSAPSSNVTVSSYICAENDTPSAINGATGGTISTVFVNDKINGASFLPTDVTFSTSSLPTGIVFNSDGTITVAPNTIAGTHLITYTICMSAYTSVCDSATVEIIIERPAIDAVTETTASINSNIGGTTISLTANDTLNGTPVTVGTGAGEVTFTLVSTLPAGLTLNADKTITVAPGTASGNYEVEYTICDNDHALNCDTVKSYVQVTGDVLVANADNPNPVTQSSSAQTIITVTSNDTRNGQPLTASEVKITTTAADPSGYLTLDPATGTATLGANAPAGTYTLTYSICDKTNASNCSTATVNLTVNAPVVIPAIDAVTETTASINSNIGGTTISLTANDTLNGTPVTVGTGAGEVTFTLVSTLPAGLTLNADKTITVAPGTASGNYEVEYTICDNDHALNCDTVKSYVQVTGDVLVANTDNPSAVTQSSSAQTIITVTSNDIRNGQPLTASEVKITTTTADPSGYLTLDPATGVATLGANAPAGTYALTYSICDKTNASNCSTASVNLTVNAPVVIPAIDAVTETTASINSNNGGTTISLTANDTLDGTPVTVGTGAGQISFTLISTLPAGLTLNADKTITVAPGTASGNYEVEYTICDNGHALNCDTVKSYVQVAGDVLVANADNPASVTQSSSAQTIITVTSNDTRNGQPLTASEVKITITTADPSGYLTLDPATGVATLGANAPAGAYALTYSICDKTNASNCSTATVNLTVNAPVVIPAIDAVTETTASINSNNGGTTISLTANDTLDGTPVTLGTCAGQVSFTLISTLPAGLTLNADKSITVAPGTASGNYEVEYTICDNDHALNCDTVKSYVQVTGDVLVANTDNPASVTQSSSAQTIITVTSNDTRNGQPLTASEVKITTTTADPSGYLTLDPATGIVVLGANSPAGAYALTYSICDKTNASNCSTASVNLTVNAPVVIPVIDAVTETTASINSNNGGTTMSLTANDTLNGTPVTVGTGAGQVSFTLISTLPAGLTLNADKSITVAPGTASGNYEVEYTICDNDHALNCDTVKSYVQVTGDVLVLKDDLAGPIVGVNHPVNVINVLGNDTKNGLPITASDVNLSVTITDPAGYLSLNPDGTVVLKENAPAGTYELTYQVCELNTTNCSTATVKVTVVLPTMTITANSYCSNDVPYVSYNVTPDNFTTNNLLTVRWIDSANNVVATQTNLPLSGSILWPGAIVDSNGIGVDWPGWLLTNGQWIEGADGFEKTRTGVTMEFSLNPTVSMVVSYPPATPQCNARPTFEIKANNDSAGPIDAKKGISTALNIFSNDRLNGITFNQTAVVLSTVVANPNLVLNADGSVDVKSGTPSGTYQLTYQICEASNSSNCSQAVVNVTVVNSDDSATAPQIIAKDDLQVNVDGINGQLEFINILDNDLLNGLKIDPVSVVISNTPKSPYFEFNADGTVNVKPNTPGGNYALVYQVCEKANSSNCSSATLNVFVEVPNIAIIKTAVFNDENGNGFANAGETITYKFKVTNTGNVPLTKITVKDPLPGVVISGQALDLAVGEANENNFTAQYKIKQSDIILGTVSNQATAIGFSARGVDVEDKSDDESNTGDNPTVLNLKRLSNQSAECFLSKWRFKKCKILYSRN